MGGRFLLGAVPPSATPPESLRARCTSCTSSSTTRRAPSRFPTTSPPRWPPPRPPRPPGPGCPTAQQRQHAEAVLAAKKPETRERRVAATVERSPPADRSPPRPGRAYAAVMTTIEAVRGDITTQHGRRDRQRRELRRCSAAAASTAPSTPPPGPALLEECRALRRTTHRAGLAVGDAVATGAGDLPCRWVVHTVGPEPAPRRDRPAPARVVLRAQPGGRPRARRPHASRSPP